MKDELNPLIIQQRVVAFDVIRGLAIVVIIFVHRIHYTWKGMANTELMYDYIGENPLIIIPVVLTIIAFMMAGIFYVVSGTVNVYVTYFKYQQSLDLRILKVSILGGIWLIILNYIYRILFGNGIDINASEYPIGLITGFVKYGTLSWSWRLVAETGTLFVIGINICTVSIVLYTLLKKQQEIDTIERKFIILGLVFLIFSIPGKFYGLPLFDQFINLNIGAAILIGWIVTEFSIFPYLSFGFFGAYTGLVIATSTAKAEIRIAMKRTYLPMLIVGLLGVLFFNSDTPWGDRLLKTSLTILGLGIFLFFQIYLLNKLDLNNSNRLKLLQLFGRSSLTVYFFEGLIAELAVKLLNIGFGNDWSENILLVLIFALGLFLFWSGILIVWYKRDFVYSVEWFTNRFIKGKSVKTQIHQ
ncbi:MAG: hypothetical protein INQ03_17575 [Candidatus Heimdallarchaeota archaeon]|nr:hypothetical protein [Candidatus Heimdallarchaeota archaeon]